MIWYDATKSAGAAHRSGLMRVNARLLGALGPAAAAVRWPDWKRDVAPGDWFFTTEIFTAEERLGFAEFLRARPCRTGALFHDAIPLRHPHITWPQSVDRHPGYMKMLAGFDRVWAVSEASRRDLLGFWRWQGIEKPPPVDVLPLGANFDGSARTTAVRPLPGPARLLCTGILEPRKNQAFLLGVCEGLWSEGLAFELHLVGRVNPHFGKPLLSRLKSLARRQPGLHYHGAAGDDLLAGLLATARATVFPTIAEGCGLPLLESLWHGVPCVCSDLPVLRENADGGGCLAVAPNDHAAWARALHDVIADDALREKLAGQAVTRPLPGWTDTAGALLGQLR